MFSIGFVKEKSNYLQRLLTATQANHNDLLRNSQDRKTTLVEAV